MTEATKDILIEKMVDRPAELTPADIGAIMADEELREIYEVSVRLTDALQSGPEIDMDREWELLNARIAARQPRKRRLFRRMVRIAAAAAVVVLLGAVVVKMLPKAPEDAGMLTAETAGTGEQIEQQRDTVAEPSVITPMQVAEMNIGREHIADAVPLGGHSGAIGRSATSPRADNFDIDEYIAREQARIDNEIAMAMAEVYEAEYAVYSDVADDLLDVDTMEYDAMGFHHIPDAEIDKLIML